METARAKFALAGPRRVRPQPQEDRVLDGERHPRLEFGLYRTRFGMLAAVGSILTNDAAGAIGSETP